MAACLAAFLAACAAGRVPPGPGPTEPRLTDSLLVAPDGMELALRSWRPEGEPTAVLLALHGFNDYSRAFKAPGEWWADRGIATYAYDQRGFGETSYRGLWAGTEALVDDLKTAVRLLRARHPGTPLYLLGDSMGGAVVLVAMTGAKPPNVDGAILVAPAVWARSQMPFYMRGALWVAARLLPWAQVTGEGLDIQASDNIERLREMGRDPLYVKRTRIGALEGLTDLMSEALDRGGRLRAPALLLYGEKDEVIPLEPTLALWHRLPDGPRAEQRPALYAEGWHLLLQDLGAERVLADIVAWIADPRAPLPSGADLRALDALAEGARPGTPRREARSFRPPDRPGAAAEMNAAESPRPAPSARAGRRGGGED
jgi:alpha-beta hydrolase superfamily lysophospholipase